MKSIAFMALLALLIPCFAEPDSVTTGPYKVTFDLGVPKDTYEINISNPRTSETPDDVHIERTIRIHTGNLKIKYNKPFDYIQRDGILRITLDHCDEPEYDYVRTQDYLIKSWEQGFSSARHPSYYNINVIGVKIDGYDGALASYTMEAYPGPDMDCYVAAYYPSSTLFVAIDSEHPYPWKDGFMQLVKTIHVEKINGTL